MCVNGRDIAAKPLEGEGSAEGQSQCHEFSLNNESLSASQTLAYVKALRDVNIPSPDPSEGPFRGIC